MCQYWYLLRKFLLFTRVFRTRVTKWPLYNYKRQKTQGTVLYLSVGGAIPTGRPKNKTTQLGWFCFWLFMGFNPVTLCFGRRIAAVNCNACERRRGRMKRAGVGAAVESCPRSKRARVRAPQEWVSQVFAVFSLQNKTLNRYFRFGVKCFHHPYMSLYLQLYILVFCKTFLLCACLRFRFF